MWAVCDKDQSVLVHLRIDALTAKNSCQKNYVSNTADIKQRDAYDRHRQ